MKIKTNMWNDHEYTKDMLHQTGKSMLINTILIGILITIEFYILSYIFILLNITLGVMILISKRKHDKTKQNDRQTTSKTNN